MKDTKWTLKIEKTTEWSDFIGGNSDYHETKEIAFMGEVTNLSNDSFVKIIELFTNSKRV